MDVRFAPHNSHFSGVEAFETLDPQLSNLKNEPYVFESPVLKELPTDIAGIYTVSGGRQIGKTTLLKQWMLKLMQKGVPPKAIVFITGEIIDDSHALISVVQNILSEMPSDKLTYLLIDEITYIKDWDKGIKFLADAGCFRNTEVILTGSELTIIKEASMRFPGRRGLAKKTNFHIFPLSFFEVVSMKHGITEVKDETDVALLYSEFENYLKHGGYLTAINDLTKNNRISEATLITYADWIRGDVLKRGKQEHYLKEILGAIIKRYGSQITWNALSHDLSINHHKTVADYIALLEVMDAVFVQEALIEDKLVPAVKKAKKVMFCDPFIFHAIRFWLNKVDDPYTNQISAFLENAEKVSTLVEALTVTHYRRFYPTYYIKSEGEVDLAYIDQGRFIPREIKWTNQIRPKDLKQIGKYPNGLILTKVKASSEIQGVKTQALVVNLFNLHESMEK